MKHFMFDIDGTLVESYEFDSECFACAVKEVMGIEIETDWATYPHVSDAGILQQILDSNRGFNKAQYEPLVKVSFLNKIKNCIAKAPVKPIAGACLFIETLRARKDVSISFATGGWYESAVIKLQSAGINFSDIPIASSNDHFDRARIMKLSAHRAAVESNDSVTYFGDGIWDKNACEELGFNFVLVGDRLSHHTRITNFESFEQLLIDAGL